MKKLFAIVTFLCSAFAHAQITPSFAQGQILTAAELNAAFAQAVNMAGSTMTGALYAPTLTSPNAIITGGSISGITLTLSAPLPVGSGGTGVSTATGSGSTVLSNGPSLSSPTIATPTVTGIAALQGGFNASASSDIAAANSSLVMQDTSGSNGAHITFEKNTTEQWDLHSVSSNGEFSFDRYVSGAYTDSPVTVLGTTGLTGLSDGLALSGGSTTSATPVGNGFTAYGNFTDAYTANQSALPEWAFQINMQSSVGAGQGTPNGDKVAFFTGANQLAGSGSVWGGNTVAQSATTGVGSEGLIGYEIDMNPNNTSMPGSATPAAPNFVAGLALAGGGTQSAETSILITGNNTWYRGIYIDGEGSGNGAVIENSFEDEGRAVNSYLLNGSHAYGIKGDSGSFSSGFMTIPNGSNIQWKNSAGALENGISLDASNNLQLGYGGMGNIEYWGNAVPDANNTLTLGTSGLQWSTIYGVAGTFSGALTAASLGATGNIAANAANATLNLNDTSGTGTASADFYANGSARWALVDSNSSNVFQLYRYVSGTLTDEPISVSNSTGLVTLSDGFTSNATSSIASSTPLMQLNDTSGTSYGDVRYLSNGTLTWALRGNSNAGAWSLNRYNSGSLVDTPIAVSNSTGIVSMPDGVAGVTTGIAAASGVVGQYLASPTPIGSPVAMTSNTAINLNSLSLPAGDWDVWMAVQYNPTGTLQEEISSISTTTGTNNSTFGAYSEYSSLSQAGVSTYAIGPIQENLSATTTIYAVGMTIFTSGTVNGYGQLYARRRR
jgi:hypothetical protein